MPNPQAKLEVVLFDNGQIAVNGPLQDAFLCDGLLGAAKRAVDEFQQKLKSGEIKPPSPIVLPNPVGMSNGRR